VSHENGQHDEPRRGLLVDWGGVMTTSVFDTFRGFCEAEGLDTDAVAHRFRHDPASRELLIGLETGTIEPEMVAAVRRAREAGVQTGLISNSWGTRRYDRDLLSELFDSVVLSGEEGMRKPTPEIYSLGAQRIGLAPEACVFVDDLAFNLKPALALGMATVHHRQPAETIDELERLLAVGLT